MNVCGSLLDPYIEIFLSTLYKDFNSLDYYLLIIGFGYLVTYTNVNYLNEGGSLLDTGPGSDVSNYTSYNFLCIESLFINQLVYTYLYMLYYEIRTCLRILTINLLDLVFIILLFPTYPFCTFFDSLDHIEMISLTFFMTTMNV